MYEVFPIYFIISKIYKVLLELLEIHLKKFQNFWNFEI